MRRIVRERVFRTLRRRCSVAQAGRYLRECVAHKELVQVLTISECKGWELTYRYKKVKRAR